MKSPSSTFSSDPRPARRCTRLPIAGAIAALLVLAADVTAFRALSPWQALSARIDHWYYQYVIADRLALARLARERNGERRAVVLGTSRMMAAWRPELLEEPLPEDLRVTRLAHARVFPPEIRAAAGALRDRAPDVAVLGISEVDTHFPVRLDRRTAFPSAVVYFEAARHLGVGWLFSEREGLYRTVVGHAVGGYRYRDILGDAGLDRLRRFPGVEEPRRPPVLDLLGEQVLAEIEALPSDRPLTAKRRLELREQVEAIGRVRPGPDAAANLDFLQRAVRILREAGSAVVIVELPIHPAGRLLYDPALRGDFLTVAESLERDSGARVIRLEDAAAFDRGDFRDLTHLNGGGALRVTRTVLTAMLAP